MGITIYGSPRSRTMRVLWALEEMGLDYRHIPLTFSDPALKRPEFLALNPAGSVPLLVDGDLALPESLAITLYLAKTYAADGNQPLYPNAASDQAQVWRWSLWAQQHLEPWLQKDAIPEGLRTAISAHAGPLIENALNVLNRVLTERDWLAADWFTVADMNVAGVLSPSRAAGLSLENHVGVRSWLDRCYARPAAIAARARHQD